MNSLIIKRNLNSISQRDLAAKAGIAYKTLQLLESNEVDPRLSTLEQITQALGYPPHAIQCRIDRLLSLHQNSVAISSEQIIHHGSKSWKIWLFNFVDEFRRNQKPRTLIQGPPHPYCPKKIRALFASTAETLCQERKLSYPLWCQSIAPLKKPWFVTKSEVLKSFALLESPLHFRKRNIFVLGNFLSRY